MIEKFTLNNPRSAEYVVVSKGRKDTAQHSAAAPCHDHRQAVIESEKMHRHYEHGIEIQFSEEA